MRKSKIRLILLLSFTMFFACKKTTETTPKPSLNFEVKVFLLEMIDIMKTNSINRLKIDWVKFSESVLKEAETAKDIASAEPAIKRALSLLGDNHSIYVTNAGKYISSNTSDYVNNIDKIGLVPDNMGYVKVESFSGTVAQGQAFALNIQKTIKEADKENLKGWIVDLRGNGGGNMWPMIAGLGPILGEGLLGHFINPNNVESAWYYKNGMAMLDISTMEVVKEPYVLKKSLPKVAVLINSSVASSGEATAIAFKGRPNTKFFGTPTYGLSTANSPFTVLNEGTLILTYATMADRNKTKFGAKVNPDLQTNTEGSTNSEAIKWLNQ